MSLSGNLEDASLADVAQFVQLGGRTGTLVLKAGDGRGAIGFYRGRIVSASCPSSKRLGEALVKSGVVDPETLEAALRVQEAERPRRSLGHILLARGALTAAELENAITSGIVAAIAKLVTWTEGTFEFFLDDLEPVDDVALHPGEVIPPVALDTRMVLLEAMRLLDERRRQHATTRPPARRAPAAAADDRRGAGSNGEDGATRAEHALVEVSAREGQPRPARPSTPGPRVQVLTEDPALALALSADGGAEGCEVSRVTLRDAGSVQPHEAPPVVVVDLRGAGARIDAVAHLRRTRPRAAIVAVAPLPETAREAYDAGALAVVPPDLDAIAACLRSVMRHRLDQSDDSVIADGVRSGLARLRRVITELRAGAITSTVSLNLMQAVSESVERAVLFVLRRDVLVALGAFGYDVRGQPLADRTRGLKVELQAARALADCIDDGQARVGSCEEHRVPDDVAEILGRPRTGQVVVLPVIGGQRPIAVMYADNGLTERAIEGIEVLELAMTQVGLAFENELLRRQLRPTDGAPSR